jgi:DNA-binding FrmR family transcriptional regulator
MLEEDKYCIDILTQTSATSSALNSFAKEILESHIRSCVSEGVKNGDDEKIEELIYAIERFVR